MTTFTEIEGLPVIARESAEQLGEVKHLIVASGHVQSIHVAGRGGNGELVTWSDIGAVGDDAILVDDENALRPADSDDEHRAVNGDLAMIGKPVLDDVGDELGAVTEVAFDPEDGTIRTLSVADRTIEGTRLLGVGSYAVVVAASDTD